MPTRPQYFTGVGKNRRAVHKDRSRGDDQRIDTMCIATTVERADRIARALNAFDTVQEIVLPIVLP
jgi:hypothetical protein